MNVKAVEANAEEKSRAEVEEGLLKKHEDQYEPTEEKDDGIDRVSFVNGGSQTTSSNTGEATSDTTVTSDPEGGNDLVDAEASTTKKELEEKDILSYIKNRYNKDILSVDELFAEKEANAELPEDVSKYLKYKQETGRGINDFYELQKDIETMDDSAVLASYYGSTEEGLDAQDIQDIIEDKFSYDEDLDDEKDIRKVKLAKKRELSKAKKFLNEQKDMYGVPLESSGSGLSGNQEQDLAAYKKSIEDSKSVTEQNSKRYDYFLNKTESVFNNEFKGFEFEVGEKNITFKSGDTSELKNVQSDVNNFINKFMDKDGLIMDAKGYHKALSVAMNPDKFAKHFYEQGAASALDSSNRKSKNINMDVRQQSQVSSKNGITIRPVSKGNDSGRGLKIRSTRKN
jgi:hypothetical protein